MRLRRPIQRAVKDRGGSILPAFALSLVVLCGAVGLSVDGARVYAAKQKLQAVADAAVLAAARRAMIDGDADEVGEAFARFVAASIVDPELRVRPTTPDLATPRRITAELVADVSTVLMPMLGFETVEVRAFASAEFSLTKLEVALVLDNTGSMNSGGKLGALKSSATGLVDTLLDKAPDPGDIRIALVPFAQYVNVGTSHQHASWINVPAVGVSAWSGCVGSRPHPLNVQDGGYSTPVPGIRDVVCPSPVQPLTYSRSDLATAINAMSAAGATYIPTGLVWGWRALSPREPFAQSEGENRDADGNKIKKVLILMTDGENTQSPTYPAHDGANPSVADRLTMEACDAIKATRIQIFTIAFDVTSTPIKDLMRGCASSTGLFFDAADSAQLDAAMQAIGAQLGGLRLTN